MTRSMRWISSSALSSLARDCVGLPQPRSSSAFAAATRAGGVALVLRITATSTFSAVRVWLRASERISVTALGMFGFYFSLRGLPLPRGVVVAAHLKRRRVFAWRGVGVSHREIV